MVLAAHTIEVSRYLERRQMVSGQYLTNHLEDFIHMGASWFISEFIRNDSLLGIIAFKHMLVM